MRKYTIETSFYPVFQVIFKKYQTGKKLINGLLGMVIEVSPGVRYNLLAIGIAFPIKLQK